MLAEHLFADDDVHSMARPVEPALARVVTELLEEQRVADQQELVESEPNCSINASAISSRTLVVATVIRSDAKPTPIGRQLIARVVRSKIPNAASSARSMNWPLAAASSC